MLLQVSYRQMCFNTSQNFFSLKWFGNVVYATNKKSSDFIEDFM